MAQLDRGAIGRREFLRTATLLGLSAAAATGLAGGAPRAAAADLPQGGTLRLGMRLIDISSPHTYNWIWDSNIGRQVCEYLTKTGPDNITRPYLLGELDTERGPAHLDAAAAPRHHLAQRPGASRPRTWSGT